MELKRDEMINELYTQIKYAKFINSSGVLLSTACAQFVLEHAQYYEAKIKELTEAQNGYELTIHECESDIKRLSEENERLRDMAYRLECEVHRERADTVRKMHSMMCEGRVSNDNVVIVANQIAKEMLEANNERT